MQTMHDVKEDHGIIMNAVNNTMKQEPLPDNQSYGTADSSITSSHVQSQSQSRHYDIPHLTPGGALLIAGLPLGLGAYVGYRRALHESLHSSFSASNGSYNNNNNIQGRKGESIIDRIIMHPEPPVSRNRITASSSSSIRDTSQRLLRPPHPKNILASTTATPHIPPPILAARALAIGSLISLSGTALFLSGIFYASGCQSTEELIHTLQNGAPKKLHQLENLLEKWLDLPVGKERRTAKFEYERDVKGMTEEQELEYVKRKYGQEWNWDDSGDHHVDKSK